MALILHITPRAGWKDAIDKGSYVGDSLRTEGFIHFSTPAQVVGVANVWFPGQHGLVLVCVDSARLASELRYELVDGAERPHLYGPLNLDAVIAVLPFEPDATGTFSLPDEVSRLG
jgi:uncharacterized protein (DUF952 family)